MIVNDVDYRPGLGLDPATVAIGTQVVTGLISNKKDPERLAQNQAAYQSALAGSVHALEFLKYRSGRFGTADSISAAYEGGGPIGGWATKVAQDDAWRLYQSALAAYGIGPEESSGGGATAQPGGNGTPFDGGVQTAGFGGNLGLLLAAGLALAFLARGRR